MTNYPQKIICALSLGVLLLILFAPVVVEAQQSVTTKLSVPFGTTYDVTGPDQYIRAIYIFGLGFGTLLAMLMLIIGAVQYTISEAVTSKEDAKDRMLKAIWGLVLLLAATLILSIINPTLPQLIPPQAAPIGPPTVLPSGPAPIEGGPPPVGVPPPAGGPPPPPATGSLCGNGLLESPEQCELGYQQIISGIQFVCDPSCNWQALNTP